MACCCPGFWIFVATLLNLLISPGILYWMFHDVVQSSIPQTWYNVVSEILLGFGAIYYLYAGTLVFLFCCPATQETVEHKLAAMVTPVAVCCLIALLQSKWIVFGVTFLVCACLVLFVVLIMTCLNPNPEPEFTGDLESSSESENEPLLSHTIQVTRVITFYASTGDM